MNVAAVQQQPIKTKHRAMWALGDYPAVAAELISPLGRRLVEACDVRADEHVLDVAAGSGNVAIPAAERGARVVASDLTPQLLDAGRSAAAERGLTLEWQEADAEALPYEDSRFDAVLSCVGVMFTPDHQAAADELVRVCRPGGRIGLINWTPEGFIGQMFSTMKPYAPPPPAGASPPPLWGDPDHVTALLGDRVDDLAFDRRTVAVDRFARPEEFVDFFKANYGPTIAVYRGLADDPDRVAALDDELRVLAERFSLGPGCHLEWEYLQATATRS